MTPVLLDATALDRLLPPLHAVRELRDAVLAGAVSARGAARSRVPVAAGELLLMPADGAEFTGVKVAGVAPDNPARGLPRITGGYLLMRADTLLPVAYLDASALTLIRTAALSALAVDLLAPPDAARLLLYGTGPQALAHLQALHAVRPIERVDVAGHRGAAAEEFVRKCLARGHFAELATADSVERADVVACCTSATDPLFAGERLAPHATVVAMGSHTPDARELDDVALRRSTVVVEDRPTARREAGDVIFAEHDGPLPLHSLTALVHGKVQVAPEHPRVFKSVGMAWEDLTIAAAAYRAQEARG
jgi:ornithine cyclodeaminase/alanine dehydrogenase-like protein (mu-crystallin family)